MTNSVRVSRADWARADWARADWARADWAVGTLFVLVVPVYPVILSLDQRCEPDHQITA